jgi:hypothetical protein
MRMFCSMGTADRVLSSGCGEHVRTVCMVRCLNSITARFVFAEEEEEEEEGDCSITMHTEQQENGSHVSPITDTTSLDVSSFH